MNNESHRTGNPYAASPPVSKSVRTGNNGGHQDQCWSCGEALPIVSDAFCSHCGESLDAALSEDQTASHLAATCPECFTAIPPSAHRQFFQTSPSMIGAGTIFLVVSVLGAALILISTGHSGIAMTLFIFGLFFSLAMFRGHGCTKPHVKNVGGPRSATKI